MQKMHREYFACLRYVFAIAGGAGLLHVLSTTVNPMMLDRQDLCHLSCITLHHQSYSNLGLLKAVSEDGGTRRRQARKSHMYTAACVMESFSPKAGCLCWVCGDIRAYCIFYNWLSSSSVAAGLGG